MDAYIRSLIEKEVIPGLSALAGRGDRVVFSQHYGLKSRIPKKDPLHERALYDVASLTKPLVTAFLILYLVEKKEISLETSVSKIFPQLHHFESMTISHLLTHTSGLPGWYPFYLFGEEYLSQFNSIPLNSRPGSQVVYSCPGYILLYYIIEKCSGLSFVEFAKHIIFRPLQLRDTFLRVPDSRKHEAVPTEMGDGYQRQLATEWALGSPEHREPVESFSWREEMIQGDTNDLYSFHLGGSAGNAGLFSTSHDLFRMGLQFFPETATILKWETLQQCWNNFTPFKRSHRTVGFKRNSSLITSGGRAFSRRAIGHNGFTGCSMWLDRHHKTKQNITVILLTNLIHPQVPNIKFRKTQRTLSKIFLRSFL